MYARNPKTGAPIRILKSDSNIWRDQKTLVWLDEATIEAAAAAGTLERFERWDVGVVGLAANSAACRAGLQPKILLSLDDQPFTLDVWLELGNWKDYTMICLSKATIEEIGTEAFSRYNLRNLVCLDELSIVYPFLGSAWNQGARAKADAQLMIAMVLRESRVMNLKREDLEAERLAVADSYGVRIEPTVSAPPPLWFVTQYYVPEKAKRRREIQACLEANLACPLVDRVILLNEAAGVGPKHDKIAEINVGKRLTYADVLKWISQEELGSDDAIIVFANADIFLDAESTRLLWSVNLRDPKRFLALLRWEVTGTDATAVVNAKLFGPRPDSQDTWIVSAAAVRDAFTATTDWTPFEIPFGKAGCDNAITVEMLRKKFQIVNPAANLRTFHYHTSQVRNYDPKEIVDRPAYLHIEPTGIHDMEAITRPPAAAINTTFKGVGFSRWLKGPSSPAQLATFCKMLSRASNGVFDLAPGAENFWQPPAVPLYSFQNAFQTRDGLPYTYNGVIIGSTKAASDAWSKAKMAVLAAALEVEQTFAVPITDAIAASSVEYCSKYLGKAFLMRKLLCKPVVDLIASKVKGSSADALPLFRWTAGEVPIIGREDAQQVWAKDLSAWLPQDPAADLMRREEVEALRDAFLGWEESLLQEEENPKRLVIVCDDKYVTEDVAEALEKELEGVGVTTKVVWAGRTNLAAVAGAMRGAWGFIVGAATMVPWLWMLPKGSFVWEVQSEMEPSGTGLHMAAAAEVEHRLSIVPKGTKLTAADQAALVERVAGSVLEELERGLGPTTDAKAPGDAADVLPLIHMPASPLGSFFAHAGDSFREMAKLWAAKGYVSIKEDPTVTQVWLDVNGKKHLLYDRPTLEWLARAPPAEKTWPNGVALFGNPAPPTDLPSGQPWFFWPRKPQLVEDLVASGVGQEAAGWSTRPQTLVFYGRSENAVQRQRRTVADWAPVCSEFVHVDGLKPYPFTQREYLERLAAARYGLCLAGYGNKCHREIECMAMGCVPIVAPEVDMTNYAMPPREGVHFFRAAGPEEAAALVAETTEDRWMKMSSAARYWWLQNASADGSWALTKKLLDI